MSARDKKRAALARFKAAREMGVSGGAASSALDELDDDDDDNDNVYDLLTEEEYQRLVRAKREREDFVVDDDGLGYIDDGEEHWGDEGDGDLKGTRNQSTHATAALTTKALQKARKASAALNKSAQAAVAAGGGGGGAALAHNNRCIWEFVNKGVVGGAGGGGGGGLGDEETTRNAAGTGSSVFSKNRGAGAKAKPKRVVDDIINQLDDVVAPPVNNKSKRARGPGPGGTGSRGSVPRSSAHRLPHHHRHRPQGGPAKAAAAPSRYGVRRDTEVSYDDDAEDNQFPSAWDDDDDVDDNGGHPMADSDAETKGPSSPTASVGSAKAVRFAEPVADTDKNRSTTDSSGLAPSDAKGGGSGHDDEGKKEAEDEAPVRRRVLARPKLAQAARPPMGAKAAKPASSSTGLASLPLATSFNFAPDLLSGDAPASAGATGPSAGQIDVAHLLQNPVPPKDVAQDGTNDADAAPPAPADPYVDMFWLDIAERNGDVLLFGKVRHNNSFISACCVVRGCVRNLFVLPREGCGLQQVHAEVSSLLKKVLPQKAGVSWRGKPVHRQYAFDDPTIPKTSQQYLKVVYSSQHPAPPVEACQQGGDAFAKILNYSASVTETFLVKRQLKGPCWIRLSNPSAVSGSISHCKAEFQLDSYKGVSPVRENAPPPPPVTSVTLKFQTVPGVNNKSEIVAAAAVFHNSVNLEGSSDAMNPRNVQQLCLIRPLTGVPFPRDLDTEMVHPIRKEVNERAMLSRLLAQLGQWDPDVLVGHNIWGYELELLLSRCNDLKVGTWSKLGRCRRSDPIKKLSNWALATAVAGRLVCDTYLSSKELLRETMYSLTNLAASQLKTNRIEIEAVDVPQCFDTSKTVVQLALHTLLDAQLVQRLMLHLQILPLTHQLTCVAGNLWSHTLKTNRAERTEYLLLHEFHRLKYIAPEKKVAAKTDTKATKAKYAGGLVLEPKRGLYDSFILLLDFNSLYPSIIQEYNLCFTTVDWAPFRESEEESEATSLPPFPGEDVERGVLPRVIHSLVERRRNVKKLLKSEKNPLKKAELDIRQQALKLTANSMYGCLGFSNSRFFAQPIAAMVTSMGRETLQRTVDIAQNTVGLEVIYGDTDSIMINTRLNDESDIRKVRELGERVKKEVNRLYKTLELEIDGIFRSMLLLKKKKYAAKTVEELPNGQIKYGQELKGLDLVRRDWCIQSKDSGRYVTDQILSGQDSEIVVGNILSHLEGLAAKMRNGELALDKYVITKGLSKHPNDYPDAKAQPHVQVAKAMLEQNRPVNTGDHIPYIITASVEEAEADPKGPSPAERARHPDDIARSGGSLKPDVEWYLVNQILPPIARLCEPIEGLSQPVLADKLGLDGSKFNQTARHYDADESELIDYTPASLLKDEERFKTVRPLRLYCSSCGNDSEFPGVFHIVKDELTRTETAVSGLRCTNSNCTKPMFLGQSSHFECFSRIANTMTIWVRGLMIEYYEGLVRCDEPGCGLETRQLSVAGSCCLRRGCQGQLRPVDSELELQTHLKYLETLFDHDHAMSQLDAKLKGVDTNSLLLTKADRATFNELHQIARRYLESCAFNWIGPSFWKGLLGTNATRRKLHS